MFLTKTQIFNKFFGFIAVLSFFLLHFIMSSVIMNGVVRKADNKLTQFGGK